MQQTGFIDLGALDNLRSELINDNIIHDTTSIEVLELQRKVGNTVGNMTAMVSSLVISGFMLTYGAPLIAVAFVAVPLLTIAADAFFDQSKSTDQSMLSFIVNKKRGLNSLENTINPFLIIGAPLLLVPLMTPLLLAGMGFAGAPIVATILSTLIIIAAEQFIIDTIHNIRSINHDRNLCKELNPREVEEQWPSTSLLETPMEFLKAVFLPKEYKAEMADKRQKILKKASFEANKTDSTRLFTRIFKRLGDKLLTFLTPLFAPIMLLIGLAKKTGITTLNRLPGEGKKGVKAGLINAGLEIFARTSVVGFVIAGLFDMTVGALSIRTTMQQLKELKKDESKHSSVSDQLSGNSHNSFDNPGAPSIEDTQSMTENRSKRDLTSHQGPISRQRSPALSRRPPELTTEEKPASRRSSQPGKL